MNPRLPSAVALLTGLVCTLAAGVLADGCATDVAEPTATCTSCHGNPETGNPAPPTALGGLEDRTNRGVGAHAAHFASTLSSPIACTECHQVPATVDAEGHIDTPIPAETTWGPLANADGAETRWNTDTLTCSGSYCHGGTMAEPGLDSEVDWLADRGTQTGCDSCHLFPPPAPHPEANGCEPCHVPTAGGGLLGDVTTHIDGILQLEGAGPTSCSSGCHGDDDQTHPPVDNAGNTDTTSVGVGAHEAHMDATLGVSVACSTCHPVPAGVNDGDHLNGTTEVVFSGPAVASGVDATYDPATATCTTYCHGASIPGGTAITPDWTVVDGTFSACGACHGNPPPAPHPASSNCAGCHGDGGASDPSAHIDGTLDF